MENYKILLISLSIFVVIIFVSIFCIIFFTNNISQKIEIISRNYRNKRGYKILVKNEYDSLLDDYKKKNMSVDINKIEENFIEILKLTDKEIRSEIDDGKILFNTNNHRVIGLKYNSVKNDINIKIIKTDFNTYISFLENFLKNYKEVMKDRDFIKNHLKKYNNINWTNSQTLFKSHLVFLWRLGCTIIRDDYNKDYINIFNKEFDILFSILKNVQNGYYKNYDWFLFSSHYPTILVYKLLIDWKIEKKINNTYIEEIFKYLPKINFSKKIIRNDSNVSVIGVGYISAHLFKYSNEIEKFYNFLTDVKNSDVYKNEINLCYRIPNENGFQQGLYFDDGFIVHKNLANYNYIFAYLHTSYFYKYFFNSSQDNVIKINSALQKIQYKSRAINPSIVSRFGRFFEVYNEWSSVNNVFPEKNNLGIIIIESTKILIANYEEWSIQIKINSNLGYAEIDPINNSFFKQILFNKIMITDDFNEISIRKDSYYPGVLSYRNFLKKSESIPIAYGTKVLTFDSVHSLYKKLDDETAVIFSRVKVLEIKIQYEEFIFVCKKGIVVGYFDIRSGINDDLFLVYDSPILSKKIKSEIIYTDADGKSIIENDCKLQMVNKSILYTQYFDKIDISYKNGKINIDNWIFTIENDGLLFFKNFEKK